MLVERSSFLDMCLYYNSSSVIVFYNSTILIFATPVLNETTILIISQH